MIAHERLQPCAVLPAADFEAGLRPGELFVRCQCHGAGNTTGVQVDPWQPLLTSCGLDGSVKSWRLEGGALAEAGCPVRLNPDTPFEVPTPVKEAALGRLPAMGLAASGAETVMLTNEENSACMSVLTG